MWKPNVLCLGPGGAKGFNHLGALLALEERNFLSDVKNIIGVSIGSIIGLLITLGYKSKEIIGIANCTEMFYSINDIGSDGSKILFGLSGPHSFLDNMGFLSHDPIRQHLSKYIKDKFPTYPSIPTLKQLYMATGIQFTTVSFNLYHDQNFSGTQYFNHITSPNMSCLDAVLCSMNIPVLFQKLNIGNGLYIDGAFGDSYPIDYYDNDENAKILGLYIVEHASIQSLHPQPTLGNILTYINMVISSSMDENRIKKIQHASERCKHLRLVSRCGNISGFQLQSLEKAIMIKDGYDTAVQFLIDL